jgi:tetratricopeptide (TPR) repeat protein
VVRPLNDPGIILVPPTPMKRSILLACVLGLLGGRVFPQTLSFAEWQVRSEADERLRPRSAAYTSTEALRDEVVSLRKAFESRGSDRGTAADSVAALGFRALANSDHTLALLRFNQAYTIDPACGEAFRGFGAVFQSMDRPLEAHENYRAGLAVDSANAALHRDEGLQLMKDRYGYLQDERPKQADQALHKAHTHFATAYAIDPDDNETTYQMFVTSLLRMNCEKAWEYHDKCLVQKGRSIEEQYRSLLDSSCKR